MAKSRSYGLSSVSIMLCFESVKVIDGQGASFSPYDSHFDGDEFHISRLQLASNNSSSSSRESSQSVSSSAHECIMPFCHLSRFDEPSDLLRLTD